jgi:hypothetical protein
LKVSSDAADNSKKTLLANIENKQLSFVSAMNKLADPNLDKDAKEIKA